MKKAKPFLILLIAITMITTITASVYAAQGKKAAAMSTEKFIELCDSGTPRQVKAAIDAGAYVNAEDAKGYTALMLAALENKNAEVVSMLVKAGADIGAKNREGRTALDWAAENKNPEVASVLKKAGAR
jgi:ankyrin repeat protein